MEVLLREIKAEAQQALNTALERVFSTFAAAVLQLGKREENIEARLQNLEKAVKQIESALEDQRALEPQRAKEVETFRIKSAEYVSPEELAPRELVVLNALQEIAEVQGGEPVVEGYTNKTLAQRFMPITGRITRGSVSATLTRLRQKGIIAVEWREEDPTKRVIRLKATLKPEENTSDN